MLKLRLVYGALMIAAVVGVVIYDGRWRPIYPLFWLLISVIVCVTAFELSRLLQYTPLGTKPWFSQAGCLAIVSSVWPAHLFADRLGQFGIDPLDMTFCAFAVMGVIAFLLAAVEFDGTGSALLGLAGHILVFFYVGILGSFVVQLRWAGTDAADGAMAFFLAVFVAKGCDSGAYFVGRRFGRHKMAPAISPTKTWEGALGGLFAALALAFLLSGLSKWYQMDWPARGAVGTAAFGLVVGLVAQVGDLMESLIKRECKRKDASEHIPGFGGLLDIIDSVLFVGPVAYWFFVGCGPAAD
jgi:phosphatidate cytidylyltransferase